MTFKKFVFLMVSGTILSLLSWLTLIYFTSPQPNSWQTTLFYSSLFLALIGLIFLVSLFIRIKIGKDTFYFNYIKITLRQAILFSVLLLGCLFLQEKKLLTWWNVLFIIGAVALLELFALSKKSRI